MPYEPLYQKYYKNHYEEYRVTRDERMSARHDELNNAYMLVGFPVNDYTSYSQGHKFWVVEPNSGILFHFTYEPKRQFALYCYDFGRVNTHVFNAGIPLLELLFDLEDVAKRVIQWHKEENYAPHHTD